MMTWNLVLYTNEDGEQPVIEYLNSLEKKHRAKVLRDIELLKRFGPSREMQERIAPLGEGVFELRTKFSSNIFRILYFHWIGENLILTNGFTKKTQKTPVREIERAKKYRDDFLRRKGREKS